MITETCLDNKENLLNMTQPGKRRTEITIETRSVTIIRTGGGNSHLANCGDCGMAVPVFSEASASLIFSIGPGELAAISGTGPIHKAENEELCGNSLAAYFKQEIRYIED